MEIFSIIIEVLIVGLLLSAVAVFVFRPMQVIRGFLEFIRPSSARLGTLIFLPIWLLAYGLNKAFDLKIIEPEEDAFIDLSEEPYKSTKNLDFDFREGDKYLVANGESRDTDAFINEFLSISTANLKSAEFKVENLKPTVVKCPDSIPFYDFNLLVQHANNELKPNDSFGLFKSEQLTYFCYQDPLTVHNIIGKTSEGRKFSVYTLDDLNKKVQLRMNNKIEVEKPFNIKV